MATYVRITIHHKRGRRRVAVLKRFYKKKRFLQHNLSVVAGAEAVAFLPNYHGDSENNSVFL